MQGKKLIVIIGISAAAAMGWLSFAVGRVEDDAAYRKQLAQAEEWSGMGLYQRAIGAYEQAIAYKSTEENWKSLTDAYEKLYAENEEIYREYTKALAAAVESCPKELDYYKKLAALYEESGDYDSAYQYLKKAVESGFEDADLKQRYTESRYRCYLREAEYERFLPESGGSYAVMNGGKWDWLTTAGYYENRIGYLYLNQKTEDGGWLYASETESRLLDREGQVMGIFPFSCQEAGIFSEGYIPVKSGDLYDYYNEYAQKVFGGYDVAGAFFEGTAAVQEAGSWYVIDAAGERVSGPYDDIVLDGCGYYNRQGIVLAADEQGVYRIYDEKWKQVGDFACDEIDFCTADGLIAYREGNVWGYVNKDGAVVIEPQYDAAKSFSSGLAAVCTDEKWGFIDLENNLVIPCEYLDADYFNSDGSCMVCTWQISNLQEEEQITKVWRLLELELGIQ